MLNQNPPWDCPAAIRAGGSGSSSVGAPANHWKQWDAKPEAKERFLLYARSVATGKPVETLGLQSQRLRDILSYARSAAIGKPAETLGLQSQRLRDVFRPTLVRLPDTLRPRKYLQRKDNFYENL